MLALKNILLASRNPSRDAYIWNTASSYLNSFQTMVLLLVVTQLGNVNDASIFVMAYAVGNLMLNIGRYGTRQFQVTDIQEKYSFRDYVNSRKFSMVLFVAAMVAYLAWGVAGKDYTFEKTAVIALICAYKGIEAFEDVFHGRMQQLGRLDVATKILTIRLGLFIAGYGICYFATRDLMLTTAINVALTAVLSLVMNSSVMGEFRGKVGSCTDGVAGGGAVVGSAPAKFPRGLLLECLPIALTTVLGMYLCNAPKYIIDGVVSDEIQTCFNIVFMPVFVVALLSNLIFNPCLRKMGVLWTEGKFAEIRSMILKLTLVPVGIGAVVTLAGAWIGLPILGFVYGIDVSNYFSELVLFLAVSGVISILNLYAMVLTTMRKQKHMLYCYVAGSILMIVLGRIILIQMGLVPLCWIFLAVWILAAIYCMSVAMVTIRSAEKSSMK